MKIKNTNFNLFKVIIPHSVPGSGWNGVNSFYFFFLHTIIEKFLKNYLFILYLKGIVFHVIKY